MRGVPGVVCKGLFVWLAIGAATRGPAQEGVEERREAYLSSIVAEKLKQGDAHTWVDDDRWSIAHVCLSRGVRLDEANQYFSEVSFVSLSRGLVADTDVQMTDLLRTYLRFRDSDALSDAAKTHLLEMFRTWEVPNRDRNRNAEKTYEWPHEYTENHSLNILVGAYLIDGLLERDRVPCRELLERFLWDRARWGWSEFNSKQYGMVTSKALVLLRDFAPDESVRLTARMLLDVMFVQFASRCVGYWRGIPACRGSAMAANNRNDALRELARFWFGDPAPDAQYKAVGFLAHFLTSDYLPPPIAFTLQGNPEARGRYVATQLATTGPGKHRVPILVWVTPYVTVASAQGSGSFYDGSYASISFASDPGAVITCSYGKGRTLFQHRNVLVTFGDVQWHGSLKQTRTGSILLGTDGRVFVGQADLEEDAHVLMVGDIDEYADMDAFIKDFAAMEPAFDEGRVTWTMPGGTNVTVITRMTGDRWTFVKASVGDTPVQPDRNLLADSPWMRSVRGSGVVEIKDGSGVWVYDFRNFSAPSLERSTSVAFSPLLPDVIDGPLGMELIHVPTGEFVMGSPVGEGRSNERPQRWVCVGDFYVSRTEVTVGQYKQYLAACPDAAPPPPWYFEEWGKTDQHAMTSVSWEEAVAFCRWLSATNGGVYRLPTEAEWEKAAKGFGHRAYPWGDGYDGTQAGSPNRVYLPVGSKPMDRSPFGVMDMAGNVWEWCADRYSPRAYEVLAHHNPVGPVSGERRVLRGCGWNFDPDTFRTSYRSAYDPVKAMVHIGFRIVREVDHSMLWSAPIPCIE